MEYTYIHNHQSQFIEMFDFHELNLNSPSKDFESMCLDDTSSATKIPAAEYLQEGKYAVYDQAQEKDIAGYSNTEQGLCRNYPAVLFGDHSRVVKYINEPFFIGADGVKIIRPRKDNLIPEFLYYDLKYHNIPNTGYNRHFKYIKMISLTKASLEEQSQFLSIAHQADKSKFDGFKSQFIEMFDFHELNLNSPSKDFESMCLDDTSSATKIPAAEYLQEGKYAVYDQAQEKDIAGYSNTEQGLCRNYPAVLFGDHSRVVKYINEPFFIGADGVKIIRPRKDNLIPEFLYYDLKYHNIPNTGYNRHFKYIKMISLTKASLEEQSQFLSIAHQADKSKYYEIN